MTEYNNMELTRDLMDFIEESPSCFHATAALAKRLEDAGFTRLNEGEEWKIEGGKGYYVIRNLSSVIAFRLPASGSFKGYNIAAAHSDFPCFKIKEIGELARAEYTGLNTESYGGAILSSWMDRPLSVAGRLICRTENGMQLKLVNIDRDLLLIPNVAPHMNREINSGFRYNVACDMVPMFGDGKPEGKFMKIITEAAGVSEEDVLGADLFVYNRMKGTVWGVENEFFSCRAIDNLQCAYTSLRGFLAATPTENCAVYCNFDNEEVGSSTKQGAGSTFLYDTLRRIVGNESEEQYRMHLASSFLLSCDNAHAVHPNHPEYSDSKNRVVMGGGVVMKFNASQRYTTDGVSESFVKYLCKENDIPLQFFANRSDIGGGSTLGGIASTRVSINSADVGLAQLAMHSSYETASVADSAAMAKLNEAFFSSGLIANGAESYRFGGKE
ncbi:MAG: M18 family aminopeptidase [Ruminococcaceae bacterium]|nr:M18 family aminopeptidase [Oscillospiraceae bacterium]